MVTKTRIDMEEYRNPRYSFDDMYIGYEFTEARKYTETTKHSASKPYTIRLNEKDGEWIFEDTNKKAIGGLWRFVKAFATSDSFVISYHTTPPLNIVYKFDLVSATNDCGSYICTYKPNARLWVDVSDMVFPSNIKIKGEFPSAIYIAKFE